MIRMERDEFAILVSKLDKLGDELAEVRGRLSGGSQHMPQMAHMPVSADQGWHVAGPSNTTTATTAIHDQIRAIRQSVDGRGVVEAIRRMGTSTRRAGPYGY